MLIDYEILSILAASLGIGLLVGLQREYANHPIAGIRTFALTTLFGSVLALIGLKMDSGWLVAVGAIAITALITAANFLKPKTDDPDIGQTTEVALLLMFAVGAYLVMDDLSVGISIGAITAVVLHLKGTLSDFTHRLAAKDIRAIMQFAAISLVILPLLPNENFGPYDVFNPYEIWLMVVLIVGLGLVSYFVYKWMNKNIGTITNGIFGGLISSTATTVTFARRAKDVPEVGNLAAFIIVIASTIAILRVLIEVAIVSPQHLGAIAPPLIAEMVIMIVLCIGLYYYTKKDQSIEKMPEPDNPAQMKSALIFGALYAIILLAVAFSKDMFGHNGLFIVSIISGLTDVDAITLSLANTLNRGAITVDSAWKMILLASMSNLVFKAGMAAFLGTRQLAKFIFIIFGVAIFAGLLIIWMWPAG